jgi:serine/threonine protein kinase
LNYFFSYLSRGYLSPEVLYGKISFKSDIFSLGVIIIELLTSEKGYPDVKDVRRVHVPTY